MNSSPSTNNNNSKEPPQQPPTPSTCCKEEPGWSDPAGTALWDEAWCLITSAFEKLSTCQKEQKFTWNETCAQLYRVTLHLKRRLQEKNVRSFFEKVYQDFTTRLGSTKTKLEALVLRNLVEQYILEWGNYITVAKDVHDVMKMQSIRPPHSDTPDIFMECIQLWKLHLFMPLKERLFSSVMELINNSREEVLSVAQISKAVNLSSLDVVKETIRSFLILGDISKNEKPTKRQPISGNPAYENLDEALNIFTNHFMEPFLRSTESFYKNKTIEWMDQGIQYFIDMVCLTIELENSILRSFRSIPEETELQSSIYKALLLIMRFSCWRIHPIIEELDDIYDKATDQLMTNGKEVVMNTVIRTYANKLSESAPFLFGNEKWNYIAKVAKLLDMTKQLDLLSGSTENYVLNRGKETLDLLQCNPGGSTLEYVKSLCDIMSVFIEVSNNYLPYAIIKSSINRGLTSIINASNQIPVYITAYLNSVIRNYRRANDEESNSRIKIGLLLVDYINEKDYFFQSYERSLARRLIDSNNGSSSISIDIEHTILSSLKSSYGNLVTSRCERMFSDYHVSCTLSNEFNSTNRIEADQLEIKMLMVSTNWPLPCQICPDSPLLYLLGSINTYWELFCDFYKANHHNRRLLVLWPYSSVELIINDTNWIHKSAPYAYRIICDMPTAIVLSLFYSTNTAQLCVNSIELTITDIQNITGLSEQVLSQSIRYLTHKNYPLLLSTCMGCTDKQMFRSNPKFFSKQKRISLGIAKDKSLCNNTDKEKLYRERDITLDALIVRVMKARREMGHQNLVAEIMKLVANRFIPSTTQIKGRIQLLIEKEFLKRDPNDMNLYHYIA